MKSFSILDLAPVVEGGTVRQALLNTVALAEHAESLGFNRFWVAEHHAMPGVASAATAVLIGRVAAATKTMRIGAGGIMLPNHAPLVVAEQFGTLEAMFPGRIDLGLGRAPGSDGATARALRRYMDGADRFPEDVAELLAHLGDGPAPGGVEAVPGAGSNVPVWILGSSLFGAQLAAHLGLPYAFASHFAPQLLEDALENYRSRFRPSAYLKRPHAMMVATVYTAPTDEEARYLSTSHVQAFARLRLGIPGRLPLPVDDIKAILPPQILGELRGTFAVSAIGAPETVHRELSAILARYKPDELMITGMTHDAAAYRRSLSMTADVLHDLAGHSVAA